MRWTGEARARVSRWRLCARLVVAAVVVTLTLVVPIEGKAAEIRDSGGFNGGQDALETLASQGESLVEMEVLSDASTIPTKLSLDEIERAAKAEEHALKEARKRQQPAVESLLADFDNDGQVGKNEIKLIKENLHHIFDIDESGSIDTKEIMTMVKDDKDVQSAFKKLDRDQDSVISLQELDERWESVGAEMTVSEVADWVAYSAQLPQYADLFRQNSISGYTFPLLMQNDGARLREIGIESDMHRQQLAMFIQMKYLGMGQKPDTVRSSHCNAEAMTPAIAGEAKKAVLYLMWEPADSIPQRYQLQRRSPGESQWTLVYSGPDTEFIDIVDHDQHVIYRLTTWNSYGRSPNIFVRCERTKSMSIEANHPPSLDSLNAASTTFNSQKADATSNVKDQEQAQSEESLMFILKSYLWWLDEAIALTLFIVLPIRGFIYGDADYILRLFRRLPPNMPTRVTAEADSDKTTITDAAVTLSWEKPVDNGVPIVCYTVRWTRLKTDEVQWLKLLTLPLPHSVTIEHLRHGETYKFIVEATNAFGLVTKSSRSTYMVPVPELRGKLVPRGSSKELTVLRNQCYLCQANRNLAASERKRIPFSATLDRRILHFCSRCDLEFCHYHKGEVFHTKALSCPAVDGKCICQRCYEKRK
ncbi:hypothetical protein Poli38472_008161 [Pythium oligandrum]|uniref:Calmodulin n=1 Tax=Pythium oligandrum TaxID=41045 RepID=A0A8K1FLR3_PYTOL|nr:hypothetical protein Poli38472_008161 [Pythium oligandrum]|eukprot:TMW65519.1 hypothetical protein Poli38472_008161 [Pythium oligandrum]